MSIAPPNVKEPGTLTAAPFLQENQPQANLLLLSNPKYAILSPTACVTREVYQKTPLFKPRRESIQRFATGATTLFVLTPLVLSLFYRTLGCMGLKDWQTNFYSVSSECASLAFSDLAGKGNRTGIIAWTLLTSIWGIGTYTTLRCFLRDPSEKMRVKMLRKVYSDLADCLSNTPKNGDAETLKHIKRIAASLKVNLPVIQQRLQYIAKINAAEASLMTYKLSRASDQILGGS
jgi:hypothetical protein